MLRFFQSLFQELSDLKFDFKAHKKRKVVVYTDAILTKNVTALASSLSTKKLSSNSFATPTAPLI